MSHIVKIRQEVGDKGIKVSVNDNKLSKDNVLQYYKDATSLTYTDENGDDVGLQLVENNFILVPGVDIYNVYIPVPKGSALMDRNSKRKLADLIAIAKGGKAVGRKAAGSKAAEAEATRAEIPPAVSRPPKKSKRQAETFTIHMGWKQMQGIPPKYKQMRGAKGGVYDIQLSRGTDYTPGQLREIGLKYVKNEKNALDFEEADIFLGNYTDEIFYNSFIDKEGQKCTFPEYVTSVTYDGSHVRLYLFSRKKSLFVDSNQSDRQQSNDIHRIQTDGMPECRSLIQAPGRTQTVPHTVPVEYASIIPEGCGSSSKRSMIQSSLPSHQRSSHLLPAAQKVSRTLEQHSDGLRFTNDNGNIKTFNEKTSHAALRKEDLKVPIISKADLVVHDEILGEGSFGQVKKGTWNDIEVALKKINKVQNQKYILREIDTLQTVRHPNIIGILGVYIHSGYILLALEYFKSYNLRCVLFNEEVKRNYILGIADKNKIALQICRAVAFLHKLEIIHQDIKPENILLAVDNTIKLCDLGLSRPIQIPTALMTTIGTQAHGTRFYMAPEMLIGDAEGSLASDVWAVACVIVELFSGQFVWPIDPEASNALMELRTKVVARDIPDCSAVPEPLQSFTKMSFQFQPQNRPKASSLVDSVRYLNLRS